MKRLLLSILLVLTFVLGIGGCSDSKPAALPQPQVVMRVLDPTLEPFANMWQAEVNRRFDNAAVILVHGGDFVEGQWIVGDWQYRSGLHVRPIADVVREAKKANPGRTIVLLACNPGHIKLNIPGVYYAKSSVWCVPDRNAMDFSDAPAFRQKLAWFGKPKPAPAPKPVLSRWTEAPDVVGNIFEFICDD